MRPRALVPIVVLLVFGLVAPAATYRVKRGDTLGAIARTSGVSVATLAAANRIANPNRLLVGQVLNVPSPPAAKASSSRPAPASTVRAVHRVANGETLGGIASRYHTSVARLAQLNGIRDVDTVPAGVMLQLDGGASWVCPVPSPVRFVSGFGDPRAGGRRHQGVDLAAPRGAMVVANVAGILKHHPNPLGGNAYFLKGDDGDTYYGAHLDHFVSVDGPVVIGQAIGTVGNTGDAAGGITHLHFERMPGGGPAVDPLPLLVRACTTRS